MHRAEGCARGTGSVQVRGGAIARPLYVPGALRLYVPGAFMCGCTCLGRLTSSAACSVQLLWVAGVLRAGVVAPWLCCQAGLCVRGGQVSGGGVMGGIHGGQGETPNAASGDVRQRRQQLLAARLCRLCLSVWIMPECLAYPGRACAVLTGALVSDFCPAAEMAAPGAPLVWIMSGGVGGPSFFPFDSVRRPDTAAAPRLSFPGGEHSVGVVALVVFACLNLFEILKVCGGQTPCTCVVFVCRVPVCRSMRQCECEPLQA